jgi:protein-S-isoprenylcysteine O-methyltransferase Ste14
MKRGPLLPPTYLLLGLVAMLLLHLVFSGPRVIAGPWRLAGAGLAVVGTWLAVRADAVFKRLGTEIRPFRPSALVVTEDLYRHSRHPMYLGFILVLGGISVLAGTVLPILTAVMMAIVFTLRFVLPEERHMEEQFGDAYREYRARVRMWF